MAKTKNVKVHKRDGSLEPYDEEKLYKVAIATGLSKKQAADAISAINSWAINSKEVSSTEIRKKFTQILKEIKPSAAALYEWYQSVKQKNLKTNYDLKTS